MARLLQTKKWIPWLCRRFMTDTTEHNMIQYDTIFFGNYSIEFIYKHLTILPWISAQAGSHQTGRQTTRTQWGQSALILPCLEVLKFAFRQLPRRHFGTAPVLLSRSDSNEGQFDESENVKRTKKYVEHWLCWFWLRFSMHTPTSLHMQVSTLVLVERNIWNHHLAST